MSKRIVSIVFLVCIYGVCFGTIYNIGYRACQKFGIVEDTVDARYMVTSSGDREIGSVNAGEVVESKATKTNNYVNRRIAVINNLFEKVDSTIDDKLAFKYGFVSIYGLTQKMINRTFIADVDPAQSIIKIPEEILYSYNVPSIDDDTIDTKVNEISAVNNYLHSQGKNYLVVFALSKIERNSTTLPEYANDYSNENIDKLLSGVQAAGVDYLDLRECADEDGLYIPGAFFRTDHHWTPETGLWAYTKIAEYLQSEYGLHIDDRTLDINNYNVEVLNKVWLGSIGRRVGDTYCTPDDFAVISPKWDVSLEDTLFLNEEIQLKGGWFDTVLDREKYELVKSGKYNKYTTDVYCIYNYGNYVRNIVINKDSENLGGIYIGGNSFRQVVAPYFPLSFNKTLIDKSEYDIDKVKDNIIAEGIDTVVYIVTI